MKEYLLKIGFDPVTEEVIYVQEYIEGAKAILHIEDHVALKVKEMDINDHLYHSEYINDSLIKRYKSAQNILESTSKQFEKGVKV